MANSNIKGVLCWSQSTKHHGVMVHPITLQYYHSFILSSIHQYIKKYWDIFLVFFYLPFPPSSPAAALSAFAVLGRHFFLKSHPLWSRMLITIINMRLFNKQQHSWQTLFKIWYHIMCCIMDHYDVIYPFYLFHCVFRKWNHIIIQRELCHHTNMTQHHNNGDVFSPFSICFLFVSFSINQWWIFHEYKMNVYGVIIFHVVSISVCKCIAMCMR